MKPYAPKLTASARIQKGERTIKQEKITKQEIEILILERGLTLTDVIDVVVGLNGFVGVGFIAFADSISDYIKAMPKRRKEIAK